MTPIYQAGVTGRAASLKVSSTVTPDSSSLPRDKRHADSHPACGAASMQPHSARNLCTTRSLACSVAIIREEGREVSRYWSSQQCADHANVARSTWLSYVSRGQAPKPVTPRGVRPEWDARTVKEWHANRRATVPSPKMALRAYEHATHVQQLHLRAADEANRLRGQALRVLRTSGRTDAEISKLVKLTEWGVHVLIALYEDPNGGEL